MYSPNIEGIVPLELILESNSIIADGSGYNAYNSGKGWGNKSGGRSYRRKTCNGSGKQPEKFWFTRREIFNDEPRHCCERCGNIGIEKCDGRYPIDAKLASRIEP